MSRSHHPCNIYTHAYNRLYIILIFNYLYLVYAQVHNDEEEIRNKIQDILDKHNTDNEILWNANSIELGLEGHLLHAHYVERLQLVIFSISYLFSYF
jgi:hypothetical protein